MALKPHHPEPGSAQALPRRTRRMAALLLAALGLAGCQGLTSNSAQLRVIDASPDAGLIDSYQNNAALAYNLGFGTSTNYIPMSAGSYTLAANKAGTHQALASSTESLAAGRQYTEIIAAGLANLQQTLIPDQTTPAPAGEVAVRILNEATRTGALDIYLVPMAPLSGKPSPVPPLAASLSFGANSGYIDIPEGTYAIDVLPAGTLRTSSTVTLLSGAQVAYASGAVRTVVLIDQPPSTQPTQHATTPPGVQAIVAADADAL
jgi:hypothetical protein